MALYLEYCLRRAEAGEPLKEAHYYAMEAIRMTWWLPDKRRQRALAALEAILTRAQVSLSNQKDQPNYGPKEHRATDATGTY